MEQLRSSQTLLDINSDFNRDEQSSWDAITKPLGTVCFQGRII